MKNRHAVRALAALASLAFVNPVVRAAAATERGAVASPAEDREWATLQGEILGGPGEPAGLDQDPALRAAAQGARFKRTAEQAKQFYTQYPEHPKAMEARKAEALMLIRVGQSGDASMEGRAEEVVTAFCRDATIPEAHRAEVSATHGFAKTFQRRLKGPELNDAFEQVARDLIANYPAQPQGYESLLTISSWGDVAKTRALAQELVRPGVPVGVQQGAQSVLDRLNLVGTPLSAVLADTGTRHLEKLLHTGKPTIIYTWASWSPGSLVLGELLAKRNVDAANIIAVNLDEDPAAAGELARGRKLPGQLHYDNRSVKGALARRLGANGAPLVYLVDAQGVIRDVRGTDDLEKKLSTAGL